MKKNLLTLIAIYALRAVLNIFIFFVLARILNITDYGVLSFGFAFALLVTAFSEYGYSLLIIRDINQSKIDRSIQVSNIYFQKIVLSLFVVIISLIYIYFTFYNSEYFTVAWLFLIYAIINSFVMFNNAVFKAFETFKNELYTVISQLTVVLFGLLIFYILNVLEDIILLSMLFIVSRIVSLIYSFYLLKRLDVKISFKKHYDKTYNKYLISESFLFGLHAIFATVYIQFDTQIIAIYLTSLDVAFYQNIFKIIMIFGIISEIIGFAYMAKLSRLYITQQEDYISNISKVMNITLLLTILSFCIFAVFSEYFISLMYSDKYLAINEYILFAFIVIVLRILNFIFGTHLSLTKFQKERASSVIITVIFGVILSFYLIPNYGLQGALYNMIIVHMILFSLYVFYSVYKTKLWLFNTHSLLIGLAGTASLSFLYYQGKL